MINCQCILRYKINVTEAVAGFGHCLIQIKNNGRGICVEELTPVEARELIKTNIFTKVSADEYPYTLGSIYTDGKFKDYVNSHPKVKNKLYKVINNIDETNI